MTRRPAIFFIIFCIGTGFLLAQPIPKIDSLKKLLQHHQESDSAKVVILNQLGFEHWTVDPTLSEQYGRQALQLATELGLTKSVAMACRVIGVSFWSRGDLVNSTEYLLKSQEAYQAINDPSGLANSTMNLGMVYAELSDFDKALENYFKAQKLFEELGLQERIATVYTKIGSVYLSKGSFEIAGNYLSNSLALHTRNHYSFGMMEASNRLGLLYLETGDLTKAQEYLGNSLAIAEQNQDREHLIKNLENLARLRLLHGEYSEAKSLLDRAHPMAIKTNYKKWLRDILHDYSNLYAALNDFKKSVYYLHEYETVKDSIFNEEKAAQLANLKIAGEKQTIKLREQEIAILRQEEKIGKLTRGILASAALLILILSIVFFRIQRQRYHRKHEMAKMRKKFAEQQLLTSREKEKALQEELDNKNKELTSYTINFIRKNELIDDLREKIEALKKNLPAESREIKDLLGLLKTNQIDKDWEDFRRTFENVHHNFFGRLLEYNPDLTSAELRLCSLICLNLSIKEMAVLLAISPDSVKTARYRLRKKLDLDQDTNLTEFIMNFA